MQRILSLFVILLLAPLAFGCSSQPVETSAPTISSRVAAASPSPALSPLAPGPSPTALSGALDGTHAIGSHNVTLFSSPNPPRRGSNTLQALVTDANGAPVTDVQVAFDLDMTNMSHGKNVVQAKLTADNRYSGNVSFVMPGPWRVIVSLARSGATVETGRFTFNVSR